MVLLGWAVRTGPAPIDDWFQQLGSDMGRFRSVFLLFSTPIAVAVALLVGVIVAVRQHRRQLALALTLCPLLAIGIVRICKPLFGREKGGALAYPSGHTTFLVTVASLLVVVAGAAVWATVLAVSLSLLGMFGQAITYHYFTDTIGAALLSTAIACGVALACGDSKTEPVGGTVGELR
ncbi:PA-phosphatase [Mycobacterium sp. TNTM28]|uniref:PA-phosphatase n=2 Tax=[Mycobacterium] fortunisiensis TaxID=2600579 RepID=A0ABS6KH80_9MYCO|nr:PA-phosphatase [[Mycobacterium] fortunisiensis]